MITPLALALVVGASSPPAAATSGAAPAPAPATASTAPTSAGPANAASAKAPSAPAATPTAKVQKLAAPGLHAVDLSAEKAQFVNDYLAEKLTEASHLPVVTQSEVGALLGFERQRQLLGCSESSPECLAELSGALGADAVVTGTVAKFGTSYAVTLKVIAAKDGQSLAGASRSGLGEDALLPWLDQTAKDLARTLAPGVVEATKGVDDGGDKNALRLMLFGVEYDRRIAGPWWAGARLIAEGGGLLNHGGGAALGAAARLLGRYEPPRGDSRWHHSYTGAIGYAQYAIATKGGLAGSTFDQPGAFYSLGIEGGYQALSASLELVLFRDALLFFPNVSATVTF